MQIKDIKETMVKNKKIFLIVILLTIPISLGYIGNMHNTDTVKANITVEGRQIFINGQPFIIKGVGYASVPIGDDPHIKNRDYFTLAYADLYNRDLLLLREMGANTIRLWSLRNDADHTDFLSKAYNDGKDPIYVIAGFWVDPKLNFSSPDVRKKLKIDFRKMVSIYKDNPAILMWAIGNELNIKKSQKELDDLYSLINEMAQEAHIEEGKNGHPVTTPITDTLSIIKGYDKKLPNLDIWSIQLFRGKSFGSLFVDYSNLSAKPLIILEFGIDAYDNVTQKEDELAQAEYARLLWNEIENNSNIVIGGVLTTYSDGWWKSAYRDGCPDRNPSIQGVCGRVVTSDFPDKFANDEWWGIMRIKDNGSSPDIVEPREVYYTMKELWTVK